MRLKTKLVVAATTFTFAIVIVLSGLFLRELLRQRIEQTAANYDVMARQVLLMTRQAVESGLKARPPAEATEESLHAAVADALRSYPALTDTMDGYVRYSPAVQDVSVTDAHGVTLVSTDPAMWNQAAMARTTFNGVRDGSVGYKVREVFGPAKVLDVEAPLDRNGKPFLVVHFGMRSTFLKENYQPGLREALLFALVAGLISMVGAGLLSNVALQPIEEISRRLETLTVSKEEGAEEGAEEGRGEDAMLRVSDTIDRLGRQIRTTEAGYTDLRANLNQMLDTLRDGVVLFTPERRAAMVSDAAAIFLGKQEGETVGKRLDELFTRDSALGAAVLEAYERPGKVTAETVRLEDGREVEYALDRIDDGRGRGQMGTLLTLRDAGSAMRLEQELEVSRRLAAVGRLTAGVGHEVKNPINAMVVHLELLKSKMEAAAENGGGLNGAQKHVEILAGEMQRLDRVVQTLADFTRPMDLHLAEMDLQEVAERVVELTSVEMVSHSVEVRCDFEPVRVRADGELLRQALLNLMLNGMQSMEDGGGVLRVSVRREGDTAVLQVADEGTGIPLELMPRIFELYFTTKAKGSGIGLAMTYRIVQMHGGSMDVRSGRSPGASGGSAFTIRLPVAVAEGRTGQRLVAGRAV